MPAGKKFFNRHESYADAFFAAMYDVIYKPQEVLNTVGSPALAFMLKFLHPKMLLNRSRIRESTIDKP
jgi:hypothetical protein